MHAQRSFTQVPIFGVLWQQLFWRRQISGDIHRHPSEIEDNFTQAGVFFRKVLNQAEKDRLVDNIACHMVNAQKFIQVI